MVQEWKSRRKMMWDAEECCNGGAEKMAWVLRHGEVCHQSTELDHGAVIVM